MRSWDENGHAYHNYLEVHEEMIDGERVSREDGGRLIRVSRPDGKNEWYLATHAWLLTEGGDTVERVAP